MKIDLHTHTKFSDGTYELEKLLAEADKQNIRALAITDHDTVKAFEQLGQISHKYRVKVIKGIELTTVYKNEVIHLICLFKNNIIPQKVVDYCFEQQTMRNIRAKEMLTKANRDFGLTYDMRILYSNTDVVNKHVIFNHLASINNISYEKIKNDLSTGSYSSLKKLTFEEGVELAKSTESLCILAHPCLIKDQSILEELLQYDINGLECKYASPKNNVHYYTDMAKKNKLFISAGSDFHGDEKHGYLGECSLNYGEFEDVAKFLNFKF